ncbi:CPCC family cysteine-rich protein [Lysinibacillus sp. NPDC096418]|uniref:CPCC family cysteine-rich protein n=1 Tax=Lysinibacillus sp. NPDC096418 TaxID=3364138 RepID=UPI0037F44DEC
MCTFCIWEVNDVQYGDPFYKGCANEVSLKHALNFIKFRACDEGSINLKVLSKFPTDNTMNMI